MSEKYENRHELKKKTKKKKQDSETKNTVMVAQQGLLYMYVIYIGSLKQDCSDGWTDE